MVTQAANAILRPTRIHFHWHDWRLPTRDTRDLRRETAELVGEYFAFHYPETVIQITFDHQEYRRIECDLMFDYAFMPRSQRRQAEQLHEKEVAALVGDVMRYFVAMDSYERMRAARDRRGGNHEAYGLGAGRDSVPYPPHGYTHMPRFPLVWDKTYDGSRMYEGPIGAQAWTEPEGAPVRALGVPN